MRGHIASGSAPRRYAVGCGLAQGVTAWIGMGCQPEILAPTGVTFDERDLHELQTLAELSLRHDVFVQESLSGNEATVERALAHKSALERLAFGCTAGNKLVHRLYFRESDGAGVVPIEQDLYVTLRCEGKGGKTVVRPDTLFFATDDINFAQREFEDEDGEKIWYDVLCPKNPNDGFTSDGEEEDPRGEGRAGEGASAHEGQVIETLEQFKEAAVAGDGVADGLRKQIAQEFRYLNVKDRMYLQFIWSQYASSHHASENKLTYGGDNSVDDWHYAPALQALQTILAPRNQDVNLVGKKVSLNPDMLDDLSRFIADGLKRGSLKTVE